MEYVNSMGRSPDNTRGVMMDQATDYINSSDPQDSTTNLNTMDPDKFNHFTGTGYGKRLRRMRHNRRRAEEFRRFNELLATAGYDTASDSDSPIQTCQTMDDNSTTLNEDKSIIRSPFGMLATQSTTTAIHNDFQLQLNDEKQIQQNVHRFFFTRDDEETEIHEDSDIFHNTSEKETDTKTDIELCEIMCKSEDELEYGIKNNGSESESASASDTYTKQTQAIKELTTKMATFGLELEPARMRGEHYPIKVENLKEVNVNMNTNGINAKNYKLYTMNTPQYINTPVYFYIEPKNIFGLYTNPFKVNQFAIMVRSLTTKLQFPMHVDEDDYLYESKETGPLYQKRYKCRFVPREPGVYPVTVCLAKYGHVWNPEHIDGSPLTVIVNDNFEISIKKSIGIGDEPSSPYPCPSAFSFGPFQQQQQVKVRPQFSTVLFNNAGANMSSVACLPKNPSTSSTPIVVQVQPAKRCGSAATFIDTNLNRCNPSKVPAEPMNMMQVTTSNGMNYYNNRPIVTLTTPPVSGYLKKKAKPWGITYCAKTDEIYITARDFHQIQRFSATTGEFIGHFGTYGAAPGYFFRPTGITYDRTYNRILITDKDNHRVCVYTVYGQFSSWFGSCGYADGCFNYPWGIDVAKDGSLIAVADSRNHRIQIFTPAGQFLRKFSVFEKNPFEYKDIFNYPRGVCFDNTGKSLYVSDFNNNAVFKLDIECTSQIAITQRGECLRPQGLAVDSSGNLIVCDTRHRCLRSIAADGKLESTIEGFGRTHTHEGEIADEDFVKDDVPIDVCVVSGGKIAVVDANGIVRVF